ncbi:hypothetical protein RJ45_13525 [Photobacterium gaetbulicola]|uniref:DUF2517 family protein n=1 Tax=Photobacterium gaetbulicola TaxID=1295392 RepID=A0A0B9GWN6_9GAMM|nr:DUF2517 family protein [Photobacterium gaetbulicola]KHT63141.1 hypothetical protein RJ45_13525 [Photobacterium gaetbulicola]
MYTRYSPLRIFVRRVFVVTVGIVTFPVMMFTAMETRSRLYSYLHRVWLKTSTKPVWLIQTERAAQHLY